MQAIPIMLNQRDLLAVSPTGTGKTAAYVIPLIINLSTAKRTVNWKYF